MRALVVLFLSVAAVSAQTISYFNQGFLRQADALQDRIYLGLTQYVAGAGITLTPAGSGILSISAAGGAGQVTYNGVTVALGGAGTLTLASPNFAGQGALNTVLHGGGLGNPSWSSVANADLANSSLTYNGKTVSLGGSAILSLASADYVNQGTTTTLLHGNAAGNPSWSAVDLANDVTGDLGVTHLNGGAGALATTYWSGAGTWTTPTGTGWLLTGNTLPDAFQWLGSINNQPITFKVNSAAVANFALNDAISLGRLSSAGGAAACAIGLSSTAGGASAFALGTSSTANGANGVALGYSSSASAIQSVAVGPNSVASSQWATAVGNGANATADTATSVGYFASAQGNGSVAFGRSASALGPNSIALGTTSVANNNCSMVIDPCGSENTDSADGQFVATFTGGFYLNDSVGQMTYNVGNLTIPGKVTGPFGFYGSLLTSTTTSPLTVVSNYQFYCLNGTNQIVKLPPANHTPGLIYRFSMTNGYGSFIVTNYNGAQTIRNGSSLAYTNVGVAEVSFISDGAAWWLASRGKIVFPCASFSTTTNVPMPVAVTPYPISYNTTEFNNSQGIALLGNSTNNNFQSRIWVTNTGTYMITFSAVLKLNLQTESDYIWLVKDGTAVPRSATKFRAAANNAELPMTVNYFVNVGALSASWFELYTQSSGVQTAGNGLYSEAASGNIPAMPSIIVTVNRVSDTWP